MATTRLEPCVVINVAKLLDFLFGIFFDSYQIFKNLLSTAKKKRLVTHNDPCGGHLTDLLNNVFYYFIFMSGDGEITCTLFWIW
jgi:hypothetical protein